MGLHERPSSRESRFSLLHTSRLLVTIPLLLAVALLMILGYRASRLGGRLVPRKPSTVEMIGVVVIPIVGLSIGSCLGSLVWGYFGKKLLGFTREEVAPFVHPIIPTALRTRYRNWLLDVLFGPQTDSRGVAPDSGPGRLEKSIRRCRLGERSVTRMHGRGNHRTLGRTDDAPIQHGHAENGLGASEERQAASHAGRSRP